jgi:hypothetical protein
VDDGQLAPVAPPALTSVQKIEGALDTALTGDVEGDEKTAQMRQAFKIIWPMVRRLGIIPGDPAELDDMLLKGAGVAIALRSDGAEQPESIEQLLNPAEAIDEESGQ